MFLSCFQSSYYSFGVAATQSHFRDVYYWCQVSSDCFCWCKNLLEKHFSFHSRLAKFCALHGIDFHPIYSLHILYEKLVAAWSVSMIYLLLINKKFWGSLIDMNHLFEQTWDQLFWTHWESFQKIMPISFPCDTCFVIFPSNFLLLTIFSWSLFPTQSCTSCSKGNI